MKGMPMDRIYKAISHHIKKPTTAKHAPFIQGLYHGQWITLLIFVFLLVLYASLSIAGTPPSLPFDSIIRPPESQSPMPIPEDWTNTASLEDLCDTALTDHLVSFKNDGGAVRIDVLAQLSPVYPNTSGTDGQVQTLNVNPQNAQAARQVAAYLIKACFTRFSHDVQNIEIQISYPYRDGYGGSGLAPGDVMRLAEKDAANIDWHTVTSSNLIELTLQ
jgi:hypothetical protein